MLLLGGTMWYHITMTGNTLKIIACITMLIDHIGMILYPDILILRAIGRLSFPIFCFLIAEGIHYTRNYKKYILRLLLFALVSQIPYYFIKGSILKLNILFLFIFAVIFIKLIDNFKQNKVLMSILILISGAAITLVDTFNMVNYGWFGVLLIMLFYYLRNNPYKYLLAVILMVLYPSFNIIIHDDITFDIIQYCAVFSVIFLYLYNNQIGKLNLKYLFYYFYPIHISILVIIRCILF